jgi:hypothetical protein
VVKTGFDAFPDHQIQKLFLNVWSGRKRVLMHFQATRIKSVKKLFFTSGVVNNVVEKSLENVF